MYSKNRSCQKTCKYLMKRVQSGLVIHVLGCKVLYNIPRSLFLDYLQFKIHRVHTGWLPL